MALQGISVASDAVGTDGRHRRLADVERVNQRRSNAGAWHAVCTSTGVVTASDCSKCTRLAVNPVGAGQANISVTDGSGRTGILPVIVTEVDVKANFSALR